MERYLTSLHALNPNLLIPHYLILSCAYYELDLSLVSDEFFDQMAKRMLEVWPTLSHPHKHLITEGDLRAGTGYGLKYPSVVKGAVVALVAIAENLERKGRKRSAGKSAEKGVKRDKRAI